MKKSLLAIACCLALGLSVQNAAQAQTVSASAQTKITVTKGASPAALRRQLKEQLEVRAVKNLLGMVFKTPVAAGTESRYSTW